MKLARISIALPFLAFATPSFAQDGETPANTAELVRPDAAAVAAQQGNTLMEDRVREILREEMTRCWEMPTDQPNPDRLTVTLYFKLLPDGSLDGQPRVTSPRNYTFDPPMREAVTSALRAVRACAPYPFPTDPVVGEHYEMWRELEIRFRPSG